MANSLHSDEFAYSVNNIMACAAGRLVDQNQALTECIDLINSSPVRTYVSLVGEMRCCGTAAFDWTDQSE